MSLYLRLKRRLGYDTTQEHEDTRPLYEYTVTHLNGETSTVIANGYSVVGAVVSFKEITDTSPYASILGGGFTGKLWPTYSTTRVLEGIQEIEKRRVGQTKLYARVDNADESVLESEVNHGTLH